jgi:hypothetical protein
LIANPLLEERVPPWLPSEIEYYYQSFNCSDGQKRSYQFKALSCENQLINLLRANPNAVWINSAGKAFFEASAIPNPAALYFIGSSFNKFPCADGTYYLWINNASFNVRVQYPAYVIPTPPP